MKYLIKTVKWIPAIFIGCCSWYLSSQPHIEHMPSFWNADKLVHLVCFGVFAFWTAFACNIKSPGKLWIPSLIISLYGIADEIHQSFTPGRSSSVFDWAFDTAGAVLGSLCWILLITAINKKKSGKNN